MKRSWLAILCVFLLFVFLVISFLATVVQKTMQEREMFLEQMRETMKEPAYGVDGKPNGGQLETKPKKITKDHIFFEDRVLERFHYDENSIGKGSEVMSTAMSSLPDGVNKYLMLIPLRISLESDVSKQYADDVIGAIQKVYAKMPSDVITLDISRILFEHKDEYLFFRTDDVWTALGAYYAAKEYTQNLNIEMIGIEEYREYRLDGYKGTLRVLPGAESLGNYPDYVSYFIRKDATNEQTITSRRDKDETLTYKTPTVAVSRRGYDIFIGAYFSHTILHGDAKNGKTLMIMGDKYSKALAPWLTPYYENICLINPVYFEGGSKEFWRLFSKYQITDFLIIESAQKMGDSNMNTEIGKMMSTPIP